MSPAVALPAFVAAAGGILIMTPGPDTALVLRTAAVEGPRRGAYASAGICFGLLWRGLAAALGISAVPAVSHTAPAVLRAIGPAWLVRLGCNILFRRPRRTAAAGGAAPYADGTDAAWFWRGLFSNVTSPTVGVFFITFLPQFVPADVAVVPWIALFVVSHVVLSVIWLGLVIVAPRSIGCLLQRSAVSRTLDRVRGAVPVGAGLRLAAEGGREDRVIMQW